MKHRYLFLDLYHITRIDRLYRKIHQPERHPENPILEGENPWETFASLYGTVMYNPNEKFFQMWYLTGPRVEGTVKVRNRKALGNITVQRFGALGENLHQRHGQVYLARQS